MATWSGRGLRGSTLEDLLNHTIEQYREKKLALIQKVPTPITPIEIEQSTRHITLAYFDAKSTVDYIGVVQGVPVCFDAKECADKTFPLHNLHEHQYEFMKDFEQQEGISFLIIYYTNEHAMYYVPFATIDIYWQRMKQGGRKSITYEELVEGSIRISTDRMGQVPFLNALSMDLDQRND